VDDRDIMADIEKWNTILRDSDKVTEDDLNRAYTIYKNARNASIRDSRIDDACRIYSDAFFQMAKPVYKANNPDKSLDLIKKGLDINPNHEKLKKLHKRRVDHPDGKESIFD
jgi:mannose/fructose/N-acetylgalactosamine-specific phosphotransferase system component IIB